MIQQYIDRINAHRWADTKLKSALILAVYCNCGLIEFSRSLKTDLPLDIDDIIDHLIAADKGLLKLDQNS
ncbi:MAG: hypothetical protein ACKPE3_03080 [Sphaerospermopsis kisseleviana]